MARLTASEIIAGERLRIAAIMESPEGQARSKSALKLALYSDLSPEMAKDLLAGMPVESAFLAAMDKEGPIGIGASMGGPISRDPKAQRMKEIEQAATAHNITKGYISEATAAKRGVKVTA